jgi:hypothetical protein
MLQVRLTPLSRTLPVSPLDALIIGAVGAAMVAVWRRGVRRPTWACWARDVVVGAAVLWLLFLGLWGWHYQAPTLEERLDADSVLAVSRERAYAVATLAVSAINEAHAAAEGQSWPADAALVAALEPLLREVLPEVGVMWEPVLPTPRRSIVDRYLRWAGINGVTNPFGLDVIVNSRLLPVERPALLAHEWAHLAGFADESDASFVAWMAGVRGGPPQRYSAWLAVLPHLVGAVDPADRRSVLVTLEAGPRADLAAIAARGAADRLRPVSLVAWRMYDGFLKANRVGEGVARYDAVARLILSGADETNGRLRAPLRSSGRVPAR